MVWRAKIGGGKNEKPSFVINLKPGPFVTSRTNTMASRRKSKPSVKAKERAEPHLGGRKRHAPRKPQALKTPDRPSQRTASEFLAKAWQLANERARELGWIT